MLTNVPQCSCDSAGDLLVPWPYTASVYPKCNYQTSSSSLIECTSQKSLTYCGAANRLVPTPDPIWHALTSCQERAVTLAGWGSAYMPAVTCHCKTNPSEPYGVRKFWQNTNRPSWTDYQFPMCHDPYYENCADEGVANGNCGRLENRASCWQLTESPFNVVCNCAATARQMYTNLPPGAYIYPIEGADYAVLPCGARVLPCSSLPSNLVTSIYGPYVAACTIRFITMDECAYGTGYPTTCATPPIISRVMRDTWTCNAGAVGLFKPNQVDSWHRGYATPCYYETNRRELYNDPYRYGYTPTEIVALCGAHAISGTIQHGEPTDGSVNTYETLMASGADGHPVEGTQQCVCESGWGIGANSVGCATQLAACSATEIELHCGPVESTASCVYNSFTTVYACTCISGHGYFYDNGVVPSGGSTDPRFVLPCGARQLEYTSFPAEYKTAFCGPFASQCLLEFIKPSACPLGSNYLSVGCSILPGLDFTRRVTISCLFNPVYPLFDFAFPADSQRRAIPCGSTSPLRAMLAPEVLTFCGTGGTSGLATQNLVDGTATGASSCVCASDYGPGNGNAFCGKQLVACTTAQSSFFCGPVEGVGACWYNDEYNIGKCTCNSAGTKFFSALALDAIPEISTPNAAGAAAYVKDPNCQLPGVVSFYHSKLVFNNDLPTNPNYTCMYPSVDEVRSDLCTGCVMRRLVAPYRTPRFYPFYTDDYSSVAATTLQQMINNSTLGAGVNRTATPTFFLVHPASTNVVDSECSTSGVVKFYDRDILINGQLPPSPQLKCMYQTLDTACTSSDALNYCGSATTGCVLRRFVVPMGLSYPEIRRDAETMSSSAFQSLIDNSTVSSTYNQKASWTLVPICATLEDQRFMLPCGASVTNCTAFAPDLVAAAVGTFTATPCTLAFVKNASCAVGQTSPACTLPPPLNHIRAETVTCIQGVGYPLTNDSYPYWDPRRTKPCARQGAVIPINGTVLTTLCGPGAVAGMGSLSPIDSSITLIPDSCECQAGVHAGDVYRCEVGYLTRPCTQQEFTGFCSDVFSECKMQCYIVPMSSNVVCPGFEDHACMHTTFSGTITDVPELGRVCGAHVFSATSTVCHNRTNARGIFECDYTSTTCTCNSQWIAHATHFPDIRFCEFNYVNASCVNSTDVLQFCGYAGESCSKRCLISGACYASNQCGCKAGYSGINDHTYCASEAAMDVCDAAYSDGVESETFPCGIFGVRRVKLCSTDIDDPNDVAVSDCPSYCLCQSGTGPMPLDADQDACTGYDRPCYLEDVHAFCTNAVSCTRRCRYTAGQVGASDDCVFLPGSCVGEGTRAEVTLEVAAKARYDAAQAAIAAAAAVIAADPCLQPGIVRFNNHGGDGSINTGVVTCALPIVDTVCTPTQKLACGTTVALGTAVTPSCIYRRRVLLATNIADLDGYQDEIDRHGTETVSQLQARITANAFGAATTGRAGFQYTQVCTCNNHFGTGSGYTIEHIPGIYPTAVQKIVNVDTGSLTFVQRLPYNAPENLLPGTYATASDVRDVAFINYCSVPILTKKPNANLQCGTVYELYSAATITPEVTGEACHRRNTGTFSHAYVDHNSIAALTTSSARAITRSASTSSFSVFQCLVITGTGTCNCQSGTFTGYTFTGGDCGACASGWTGSSCHIQTCCSTNCNSPGGSECKRVMAPLATTSCQMNSASCDQLAVRAREIEYCIHGRYSWTDEQCICDDYWTFDIITRTCISTPCHPTNSPTVAALCGGPLRGQCVGLNEAAYCQCNGNYTGQYCEQHLDCDLLYPLTANSHIVSANRNFSCIQTGSTSQWLCASTTEGTWTGSKCDVFVWTTSNAARKCASPSQEQFVDTSTRSYSSPSTYIAHSHEISCECPGTSTTGGYCANAACPVNVDTSALCSSHGSCSGGHCRQTGPFSGALQCGESSQYSGCACQFDLFALCRKPGDVSLCAGSGTCTQLYTSTSFGYGCACLPGRNGTYCEESQCPRPTDRSLDRCNSVDPNGACVCPEGEVGCRCQCSSASTGHLYVGPSCNVNADSTCLTSVSSINGPIYTECNGGGTCQPVGNSTTAYACACDSVHSGSHCQFTSCGTCPGHSTCISISGQPACRCYQHWAPVADCTGLGQGCNSGMCTTSVGCQGATVPPPDTFTTTACICANSSLQDPACVYPKCQSVVVVETTGSVSYLCGKVHPYMIQFGTRRNTCPTGTCVCENTSVFNATTGLCTPRCHPTNSPTMNFPLSSGGNFVSPTTTCSCIAGYTAASGCYDAICKNNGTYVSGTGACICRPGFQGPTCNDAVCTHGFYSVSANNCTCYAPFNGTRCNVTLCTNGSPVVDSSITPNQRCQCNPPYIGVYCEVDPCLPYGHANRTSGLCACDSTHSGSTCQYSACTNGGVFNSTLGTCACSLQFHGPTCARRVCNSGTFNGTACTCPRAVAKDWTGNCTVDRCGPFGAPLSDLTDCVCSTDLTVTVGINNIVPGTNLSFACVPICQQGGSVNITTGTCVCVNNTSGPHCTTQGNVHVFSSSSSTAGAPASSTGLRSSTAPPPTHPSSSSSTAGSPFSSSSSTGATHFNASSTGGPHISVAGRHSVEPVLEIALLAMLLF